MRVGAPGKLMIAGEYSVLGPDGVALAIAVRPGVDVVATPAPRWELLRGGGPERWVEGEARHPALAFAHAALEAGRATLGPLVPHRLETIAAAGTTPGKPGLGSSASATAAILGVLFELAGREVASEKETILDLALEVHRRVQGGTGSGYDVATVVQGAVVRWSPARREARRYRWPDGLGLLAGYSGKSARTTRQLQKLERLRQGDAARTQAELVQLDGAAVALIRAFEAGAIEPILAQTRICHRALQAWDRRHRLGIVTPAIQRMVTLANEAGAAGKISGAGAGDSVIALGPRQALQATAVAWREAGLMQLEVAMDDQGLRRM